MEETLVFIDEGFLSKLPKYLGSGRYLKIDYIKFSKRLSKKQKLFCRHLFYYTAPPFQSEPPTSEQIKEKKGYDNFIISFSKNKGVTIREGRCQKIINSNSEIEYHQKGVDVLMVSDMVSVPIKFPDIKKIILITSDTDFCPIKKDTEKLGVKVILCTYYEKKRNSKFSVSHHLIDPCNNIYYITKEDFNESKLIKT